MTGRPVGWKTSDEAFSAFLAVLAGSRSRRDRLSRYEQPQVPSWVAHHRGYAARTEHYRRLLHEQHASTPLERTA